MADLDSWITEVAQSAYGWPQSLAWTYHKTRELLAAGIPGDLVECGVGNGVHPAAMAKACIDAGETRTIRLFDSFRGVPNGKKDRDVEWSKHYGDGTGTLAPTGVASCSRFAVEANLHKWGTWEADYRFHEGWFQQEVVDYAEGEPGPIAFLRLDGDLYDSYLTCLTHLYPLVSSGGVIVCDDWNLGGCREAVIDYWDSLARPWGEQPFGAEPSPITASGDVFWVKP